MPSEFTHDLIYDLGLHHALDAGFYLAKGFRVVGLEANPAFVERARAQFATEIGSGQFDLVGKALWQQDDEEISFYLNAVKDDWSSVLKGWAGKGGHPTQEIRVRSITLASLFAQFGVPYYVKCDIEGADELFVRQLMADPRRPAFVSVEAMSLDALGLLAAAGYDRFQLVNQAFNAFVAPPEPPREGRFAAVKFNGHMSGLFGRESPPQKWLTFTEAAQRYLAFRELKARDELLAHGWLDFHATTQAHLAT